MIQEKGEICIIYWKFTERGTKLGKLLWMINKESMMYVCSKWNYNDAEMMSWCNLDDDAMVNMKKLC